MFSRHLHKYGCRRGQVVKVKEVIDSNSNFLYEGKVEFHRNETPDTNVHVLSSFNVKGNEIYEFSSFKVPNIHNILSISGLNIGVPTNGNPRKYLYTNLRGSKKSYLQFDFLRECNMATQRMSRCHKGVTKNISYVELKIFSGVFSFGLAPKAYNQLGVGWFHHSCGIFGDIGNIIDFNQRKDNDEVEVNEDFKFGGGSIIGLGINRNNGKVFFTKNGVKHPKEDCKRIEHEYFFPTIGIFSSLTDSVVGFEINYGDNILDQPFEYEEMNEIDTSEKNFELLDFNQRRSFVVQNYSDFRVGLITELPKVFFR